MQLIILHPSNLMCLFILALSIFTMLSSKSWLVIWVMLEINVLVFIPLLMTNKTKYQSEMSLKYFLTQTICSIVFLSSFWAIKMNPSLFSFLTMSALLVKMGAAPFHQWLLAITESVSWLNMVLLLIFQKLGPLFTLFLLNTLNHKTLLTLTLVTVNAFLGSVGAISQTSLRKIMMYSSISHMSWLLLSMMLKSTFWLLYFTVYACVSASLMLSFSKMKLNKIMDLLGHNNRKLKNSLNLSLLSLAGLPPFSGFYPKMLIISNTTSSGFTLYLLPVILGSVISLFFYLRLAFFSVMKATNKSIWKQQTTFMQKKLIFLNLIVLPAGALILI